MLLCSSAACGTWGTCCDPSATCCNKGNVHTLVDTCARMYVKLRVQKTYEQMLQQPRRVAGKRERTLKCMSRRVCGRKEAPVAYRMLLLHARTCSSIKTFAKCGTQSIDQDAPDLERTGTASTAHRPHLSTLASRSFLLRSASHSRLPSLPSPPAFANAPACPSCHRDRHPNQMRLSYAPHTFLHTHHTCTAATN